MLRTTSILTLALLTSAPAYAQTRAEILFAQLTDEEKAGQLFMAWTLSSATGAARDKLLAQIDQAGLGGVILSLGTAVEATELIAAAQQRAKIPLLCAGDFEAGVGFRLKETTNFGNNMLIAATGSEYLARRAGEVTGLEALALGFHWNFAPVVDVNDNPANPIINVRSFGEDPQKVARFSVAFMQGNESAGVLATAKHFPGHGDVTSDSHLTMPTVPGDRARLERVELPPFRATIDAGISSIMSGHLSVPGLGEDPAVPATLSKKILTDLLRKEWGFRGLIVTDALDMGGVREKIQPEDAAVRALNAGADVLLMPPDPIAARNAIVLGVQSGLIPRERLDEAVLRILRVKDRVGALDKSRARALRGWQKRVDTRPHRELAARIAARGLTLVEDSAGNLPLPELGAKRVFVVLSDKDDERGAAIGRDLRQARRFETVRLHPKSSANAIAAANAKIADADFVIAAFAIKVRTSSGTIGIPEALRPVARALRANPKGIAISFGNPYLIRDVPEFPTYLCAFAATPFTEAAVADALLGRAPVTGRMPVRIPGRSTAGAGISYMPLRKDLPISQPSDHGLPDDLATEVRRVLSRAVRDGAFPGASACITRHGEVVAQVAVGRETYDLDSEIVTPNALYDLASLTKVCATTPAVLRLVADGKLSLDTKVSSLVPAFRGGKKGTITIRHLLTHSSGLPAYVKFFLDFEGKDRLVQCAATTDLKHDPGTKYEYSDLGLILLMACVEQVTGKAFDVVAREQVFEPLGMNSATFSKSGSPIDAMATEDDAFRGRIVDGEVHDENAFAMGGVSGHAGLFANALDVAKLGNAFLGGGRGWLPTDLARSAVQRANVIQGSSRALGWDTFVEGKSCGSKLSARSFGHTGFTGTSIWCDPTTDLCIVLLTNRVHPTRANKKVFEVRRQLADLVAESAR